MTLKAKVFYLLCLIVLVAGASIVFHRPILERVGRFLVVDTAQGAADAVIVLDTDLAYYPRLMEAAAIYNMGRADKVVINGNRKSDALRSIEKLGFAPCCPWDTDRKKMLTLLGVPEKDIISISAPGVYDTISEAQVLAVEIEPYAFDRVIIATSKSHTRRALYIWQRVLKPPQVVTVAPAKSDPYDPSAWWRSSRQVKWVLSEYGAWLVAYVKNLMGGISQ